VYAGTDRGVAKSTDGGAHWHAANNGLTEPDVNVMVIDPVRTNNVYAGTEAGVFKSVQRGAAWKLVTGVVVNDQVMALAADPRAGGTVYAATVSEGVFKTLDGGKTWIPVKEGLTDLDVEALVIDPSDTQTLYAGTAQGGVFKSTDGGGLWTAINNGLTTTTVDALAIDPLATTTLYAGTLGGGVFKSIDAGETWAEVNNGLSLEFKVTSLVVDPNRTQTVYAGLASGGGSDEDGVFKTDVGGAMWVRASNGIGLPYDTAAFALAIDPTDSATLYAGVGCAPDECDVTRVYRTLNGAGEWTDTVSIPSSYGFNALALDPAAPPTVYAGDGSLGVYKTTDGGKTWVVFNEGLDDLFVSSLTIASDGAVYAGTSTGIYKSQG
jgi:photosystem II stability/assembly factor-like uncharacterized protein